MQVSSKHRRLVLEALNCVINYLRMYYFLFIYEFCEQVKQLKIKRQSLVNIISKVYGRTLLYNGKQFFF